MSASAAAAIFGKGTSELVISQGAGSTIGDMTAGGGLAAAFNGTTNESYASACRKAATNGYVGKAFTVGKIISKATVQAANGSLAGGYDDTGGASTVSLTLYGKNGTPSSGTDGTLLATASFSDPNDNSVRTLTSTDVVTPYTNVWIYQTTAAPGTEVMNAEVVFYERV